MHSQEDTRARGPVARDVGPRRALGRGLAALMVEDPAKSVTAGDTGYRSLPIERIAPNKEQPRKVFDPVGLQELAVSIRAQGVLQPIVVRRQGDGYQIVAGERRWRAAMAAGLQYIPALVKELTDSASLQIALIENIQRRDLDPLEEAEAYHRLIHEHSLTHDELADAVGKSRAGITNSLRLLKLPEDVLALLRRGELTAGHARALLGVATQEQVQRLARDVAGRKMSVRETELRVKQLTQTPRSREPTRQVAPEPAAQKIDTRDAGVADIEARLQRHLGTKVRLLCDKGAGYIAAYFHDLDALDDLLDRLMQQ